MRIVHIVDAYLPRLGGIESQVHGLAVAQVAQGHEVHIITATKAHDGWQDETTLKVHRLTASVPFDLPLHPRAKKVITDALREINPDVAHVHVGALSPFSWSGIAASHRAHLPTLTTVHSMWGPISQTLLKISTVLWRWPQATSLSAVSETCAKPVRAISRKRVAITANGVDLSGWQHRDERTPGRVHVVCATRFAPRKRVFAILRLARLLAYDAETSHVHWTIAGAGPWLEKARNFVSKNGLSDYVALPGRLSRSELENTYARADFYIQLSVRESFGIAAIEARAAGLPVVGRSQTGFVEFVQSGVTGFLGSTDRECEKHVRELVQSPELLELMRANSRRHAPVQTWDYVTAEVLRSYNFAMQERLR